jgi:acyl-CoA oxidase
MQRADKIRRKNLNLLQKERANCDFDMVDMGSLIHGSREKLEKYVKIAKKFAKDPILRNNTDYHNLTREEKMHVGNQKLQRLTEVINESLTSENAWLYSGYFHSQLPVTLHFLMFSLCIQYLGDDDQASDLMPLVRDMKIIGNYA